MRTLVVHTGAIGDFILFCPALARLAEAGPVTLLGSPERHQLAVEAGLAEAAWSLEAVDFHSIFSTPSERLRAFLNVFDQAIVWWEDPDGSMQRQLLDCGLSEVRCHPGLPPENWTAHVSTYYAHCLGIAPEALPLNPLAGALQETTANETPILPPSCVVIHPGSGGARKCWPLESFQEIAGRLTAAGLVIRWSRGPAEADWALPEGANALPPMPLTTLFRVLVQAHCYIGNDSGISHLAAATGVPTLAIFGPTDPTRWAPRGTRVAVVQSTLDVWPTVEAVWMELVGLSIGQDRIHAPDSAKCPCKITGA